MSLLGGHCCCCGFVQEVPVMLLGFPGQGEDGSLPPKACWGYSCQDWQKGHRGRLQAFGYNKESVVNSHINLFRMWASTPDWGTVFC